MPLKNKFLTLIILITSLSVNAQTDYPVFHYGEKIHAQDSQRLSLNIYNLNYLYNTEWFSDIPLSGTQFGYQLIPELEYQVSPKFTLKGGIYLQKEFGRDKFTTIAPTFTAKYQLKHAAFLMGTLEGGPNHRFIEPLYDYSLLLRERLENGIQILVNTKPYEHDLYINWRKAIHPGDPFKEEFDIGYSGRFNLLAKDKWEVRMPMQLIYSHKGGQYDNTNEPLTSLANIALGLSITYKPEMKWLKKIEFENFYAGYKDVSFTKRQLFDKGNAYLSHLLFQLNDFGIDFRYWRGHDYIGPRGMALFNSISEKYPGLTAPDRQLLIVSFIYDKEIAKNLFFNARITPYKDFIEDITSSTGLEFSYEIYLKYVMKINLARVKNDLR